MPRTTLRDDQWLRINVTEQIKGGLPLLVQI